MGAPSDPEPPEPSANYLETLDVFDNVVRDCVHVSRHYGGIPSEHTRQYYASVLFTAMCTRAVSLAVLAPHTPWAVKVIEHWDYASMTGVARTLIETRLMFFYLCVESLDEEEWACRWNVLNLHDCQSRSRLFQELRAVRPEADDNVEGFAADAEMLRDRLRANSFFQALSPKRQAQLLKGEAAYLLPLEQLAERAGMGRNLYRFLQKLFSTHVHSLPMSFYRIGADRGRGLPSSVEEGYTSLTLSACCTMLTAARDEMIVIFGSVAPPPPHHSTAVED